jgi:adenylate cyclase
LRVLLTAILCHALRLAGDLRAALAENDDALANAHLVAEEDQQTLGFRLLIWIKAMRGHTLVMMSRHDEARPFLDELIAADEATVDVMHRLIAHASYVDMAWELNDAALAMRHGAAVRRLGEKSGNPYLMVYGRAYAGLGQAVAGEFSEAATTLSDALSLARRRRAGLEIEACMLGHLACVQSRAGLEARGQATAEEAAAVARRRGAKIWLAYAEWLIGGSTSTAFKGLLAETGAELLAHLLRTRP